METATMKKAARPTRLFIHGLESSSKGTKGIFFKERYPDMIIEDYFGAFDERMAKLNTILSDKNDLILVGSSYGGLMASYFACYNEKKIRKLILLAPALNFMPYEALNQSKLHIPAIIYHGSRDNVVPPDPVYEAAQKLFANLAWFLVNDDHSLHKTFHGLDWDDLLDNLPST